MERWLSKNVIPKAKENVLRWYACKSLPRWAKKSIEEMVDSELVNEINDRFFKSLKFGTGGIRSRTIASVVTTAEQGSSETNKPDFASVGTAYLNDFNIIGATIALFQYCSDFLKINNRTYELPSVVIAYDVRHYSKHFAELASSTWKKLGGHSIVYSAPRSTPQLSFSVRYLRCTAGIMITASHNPWYDNGFKVYFSDGAQMVDPHASGVITKFNDVEISEICKFCEKDLKGVAVIGEDSDIDKCYQTAVSETVLRKDLLEKFPISVVFSPLHGVGGVAAIPLLRANKIENHVVEQQNDMDPNFSTLESPNPENPSALKLSISTAKNVGAEIVIVTDPDGDRIAVAAKNRFGKFENFSGNVIGALLSEYRINQLKLLKKIPESGSDRVAVIKTFVTTPLIDKIAKSHGVKCINTLTGFKWIGEKMLDYENEMLSNLIKNDGIVLNYDKTSQSIRNDLLLKYSTLFIFGCEESYGCLSGTDVRDKDANSACLMACELGSYAKSIGKTICDLRDEMYIKYGYFGESVLNLHYEGADGFQKIKNIISGYKNCPPQRIDEFPVIEVIDFSRNQIMDADGKIIPPQDLFFISLADGTKFAVRASGTEPKVKFYIFAEEVVSEKSKLEKIKLKIDGKLESIKGFLRTDADIRSKIPS